MPSKSILEQKQKLVKELSERLKNSVAGVFVDYSGINVADDTKLRTDLRNANVEYTVIKNTLTKLAVKDAGLDGLDDILNGTTALATSADDLIAPAKIIGEFAEKNDNFKIKAGFMEGKVISIDEVNKLSKMPSKENLLCMLLYALNGNISGLARALQAVKEQKEAEATA